MAAIDKIYVKDIKQYDEFADWCRKQPPLTDKYGVQVALTRYLYDRPTDESLNDFPAFMAPYYVDAYVIRNCPLDYIQDELKLNYGSSYQEIKDGKLYTSVLTDAEYEMGKHYTCIMRPYYGNVNKPVKGKWFVDVVLPKGFPHFIWHHDTGGIGTWDFSDEFVVCTWASSGTTCPTMKSITRRIQKWKLPVGSKVILSGRYVGEKYVFLIRK